jgi:hypothetical protein
VTKKVVDVDQDKLERVLVEAAALRKGKNQLYGDSWKAFGSKGQLIYIYHKANRLKALLWDDVPILESKHFESADDTLLDIIVSAAHCLILLREEEEKK